MKRLRRCRLPSRMVTSTQGILLYPQRVGRSYLIGVMLGWLQPCLIWQTWSSSTQQVGSAISLPGKRLVKAQIDINMARLNYWWATIMVNAQYLPYAVGYRPPERVQEMLDAIREAMEQVSILSVEMKSL